MLGLRTHKIDFEILPSSNSKILIFLDESQYYEKPESPRLKIVAPGNSRSFEVNIDDSKINVLNSHLIGYTDVLESDDLLDLSDGIWEFTYMICPYKYLYNTKYHLRTTQLETNINLIYCSIDITDEAKNILCFKKELIDIHLLLESAKANVSFNNINKGNKDFMIAQNKVKELLKKIEIL